MDCAYHPGKEAAVACVNCGKLICLECKTELAGKNYCPPCANEIFVGKKPAEAVETPAPVAETPAGVAKKPTEDVQAPAGVRKTPAGVRKMPAGATKGPAEVAEEVAVTEEKISGAWWLMPVFLTWVGGLVAWLVNKDKAPKRSRSMLIWGIVLTFVYSIIGAGVLGVVVLALGGTLQITRLPEAAAIAVVAIVIVVAITLSLRKKGTKKKDAGDDWDDDGSDDGDD